MNGQQSNSNCSSTIAKYLWETIWITFLVVNEKTLLCVTNFIFLENTHFLCTKNSYHTCM